MINRTQDEIMEGWGNADLQKPLVSVRCITYNHAKYIGQALDGFLMQKTTFPFEIIVHDDASTDGTEQIIRAYAEQFPRLIKPIYEEENLYSKQGGAITKIVNAQIKGKYIAACEGDDYWIDPYKLQKQVDFLERNPEYEMCYTNFNIYHQKTGTFENDLLTTQPERFPHDYTLTEWILRRGYTAPMTWVYTKRLLDSYKRLPSCDGTFVMFAHFIASAKVKCLETDTTAVYRSLTESASHSPDPEKYYQRMHNLMEVQKMLVDRYNLPASLKDEITRTYFQQAYKIICMLNKKAERAEAKQYCTSRKQRIIFLGTSLAPVRTMLTKLYRKKRS